MAQVTEAAAIERARSELRIGADVPAQAWPVRYIDRPSQSYWLVVLGARDAAHGAAAVDAQSGAVMVSATLPGTQAQLAVDAARALQIAGVPAGTEIGIAWQSCTATRSPLYPLWAIGAGNETVYVDQQGRLWRSLKQGERGG
jgi:hypothetical protein